MTSGPDVVDTSNWRATDTVPTSAASSSFFERRSVSPEMRDREHSPRRFHDHRMASLSPRRPSKESTSAGSEGGCTIYVTGVHPKAQDEELRELFEKFAKVEKAQIMHDPHTQESRGFAFVTMVDRAGVDAALSGVNNTEFGGRMLSCERARRQRPRTPTPGRYYGRNERSDRDRIRRGPGGGGNDRFGDQGSREGFERGSFDRGAYDYPPYPGRRYDDRSMPARDPYERPPPRDYDRGFYERPPPLYDSRGFDRYNRPSQGGAPSGVPSYDRYDRRYMPMEGRSYSDRDAYSHSRGGSSMSMPMGDRPSSGGSGGGAWPRA